MKKLYITNATAAPAHSNFYSSFMRLPALRVLLILSIMVGINGLGWAQPWTYDFGSGTGSFTNSTASTTFLPTPTSGTARVRVGTNPGSIAMVNPGLTALGTNTELQITSNINSSSTTKFSVYDYTAAKIGYVKFAIAFSGGTNGVYKFSLGDGVNYSDNLSINTAQIFAGIEWTLGATNTISYKVLNTATYGTTGISNPTTLFVQSTTTVYQVEVYANNTTSSTNYTRSSTSYSLANATWDLWVDGVRVGTGLPKGELGTNANFDSYAFNHQTSVTAPGTIYIDDIEYSNALPTTTSITSTTSGNWSDGTTWVGGVAPTAADNVVIANGHVVTALVPITRDAGKTTTVNVGGTLATAATFTNNGTTTVNGSFQLNSGGWATGTNLIYGSSGTLIFNTTYSATNGTYWPTTSGPVNVTVNTGCPLTLGFARSVSGVFATSASTTTAGNLTINGTCQINSTAATFDAAIAYGVASTLVYNVNATMARGNEWNNSPANVTLQNNSVINYPGNWGTFTRTLTGNLTIGSGSALYMDWGSPVSGVGLLTVGGSVANSGSISLGNQPGGDIAVGGNWTRGASGVFQPNGRAVYFNGTGTQTVTVTGGGTETFNYLLVQGSGTLKLTTGTNMAVTASGGLTLASTHASSTIDINGQTLTLSGGGNLSVSSGNRFITSTVAGGILAVSTAVVTVSSGGTLTLGTNVTVSLTNGFDFGSGLTTLSGKLQINGGGYVQTNPPVYGNASTLEYNGVTSYGVSAGWTGNATTAGNGTPQNVTLTSSSINMPAGARSLAGILTIGTGSSMTLEGTAGSDLNIGGNWVNNGTFNANSRAVQFRGAAAQSLTGATTFDYLTLNNSTGLTLQASSAVTVNNNLTLTSGKLTLGANNLTLASAATITSSATNYIVTNSTGLLKRNAVGNTATLFPIGLNTTNYTPVTITNTTGTSDLSVKVGNTITNPVYTSTKIVTLQWSVTSSAVTTATITPVWVAANQAASFTNTGAGELGNYTTAYTTYPVTLAATTTTATGVVMQSGANLIVVGNTGAVYMPPPANDNCAGATAVTLDAAAITGNVAGATQSISALLCNGYTGTSDDDVWYSFTTTAAGTYTITVVGSTSFDAVVDLRTGACNGSNVSCADATTAGGTESIAVGLLASTAYFVRVYSYGSSVPATTTFTIAVTSPPASLSTNGVTTLTFTNQAPLTNSTSQTFNLSGNFLTSAPGNITVTAPNTNFQVSNNDALWGPTTTIDYGSATLATTPVYVRFTPQSSGAKSGNITFSGGGVASPPTIAISGTGVLPAPVATVAANIASTSFDANWGAVTGASSGYLLDVSTSATFSNPGPATLTESFEASAFSTSYTTGTVTLGSGVWGITTVLKGTSGVNSGTYAAQLQNATGSELISPTLPSGVSTISFWVSSSIAAGAIQVNYSTDGGSSWSAVPGSPFTGIGITKVQKNISLNNIAATTKIQFYRTAGTIYIDDISIGYTAGTPSFVTGYNAKPIAGQSTITSSVTGLTSNTNYYYRLRATDGTPSAYSNVISVLTLCDNVAITSATAAASSICSNATTTLTANGVVGTNAVVTWYSGTLGSGTNYGTGTTIVNGPGTYYALVTGDCGTPVEASVTVGVIPSPDAAGEITGTTPVTEGSAGNTYSVAAIANATSYTWVYTGTGVIINNETTNSVTLDFAVGATGGQLTVKGHNNCGDGTVSPAFTITVNPASTVPTVFNITGGGSYCSTGSGLAVDLDGSQTGVNYTLIKNGTATATIIAGTGAGISFGTQPEGIYTASGTADGSVPAIVGTSTMNGSASIIKLLPPTADAGAASVIGTSGVPYQITDATSANGTITWTEDGDGTLNNYNIINPTYSSPSTPAIATINFTLTVSNGVCPDAVKYKILYLTPSAQDLIWTGLTSEDWAVGTNWDLGVIPGPGTNVTIPTVIAPHYYPTISATAKCNNITINAGASLIDNGFLTLSTGGKLSVEHPAISAGQWHSISSPVSGETSTLFQNQYLRSYNPATGAYAEIIDIGIGLNAMQGYALWTVSSFTSPYVGGFNPATYNYTLSAASGGWNLIGNPYTSSINWDLADKTNVAGAIYIEDAGNWATYVNLAGTNAGSNFIAPTQGFFVYSPGGGSLILDNTVRVHNNTPFFKKSVTAVPNLVRLQVSGNGYRDEAVVRFVQEATAGFDGNYDAYKFYGTVPESAQLYTLGSAALSINSLPATDMVPVGIHIGTNGSYTIAATEINDLSYVTLEDTETGILTSLSKDSYSFTAAPGDFDHRFKLHFSMLAVEEAKKAPATVYSYQRTVHINMKDQQKGDIFIYNITGQLIKSIPSASGMNEVMLPVTGNYVIKVISKDKTTVRKVWIQ